MTRQLDSDGRLKHLLTLEGLPRETLCRLLDRAGQIRDAALGRTQKRSSLSGTTICTLFFEPSRARAVHSRSPRSAWVRT